MRTPLRALAALTLAAFAVGCSGDGAGKLEHGTVFGAGSARLAVAPGERFSLRWKLSVVPGNDWKVVPPEPDSAVVTGVGTDTIAGDGGRAGDGGELYLVFKAGPRAGSAKVTVENCFTCGASLKKIYHSRQTYEITVGSS